MESSNEIKLEIIKNNSKLKNLLYKISDIHFQEYLILSKESREEFEKYKKTCSEWMDAS